MTRDDVIRMAREAGLQRTNPGEAMEVVRFAAMVAAAEREACATACEALDSGRRLSTDFKAQACAAAVRARSAA